MELAKEIRKLADQTRNGDARSNMYLRDVHLADIARMALEIELEGQTALRDIEK